MFKTDSFSKKIIFLLRTFFLGLCGGKFHSIILKNVMKTFFLNVFWTFKNDWNILRTFFLDYAQILQTFPGNIASIHPSIHPPQRFSSLGSCRLLELIPTCLCCMALNCGGNWSAEETTDTGRTWNMQTQTHRKESWLRLEQGTFLLWVYSAKKNVSNSFLTATGTALIH